MADIKLYTFEMFMRNPNTPGGLGLVRHTCQAPNAAEAQRIFTESYGTGGVVAGPNLVKEK